MQVNSINFSICCSTDCLDPPLEFLLLLLMSVILVLGRLPLDHWVFAVVFSGMSLEIEFVLVLVV